MSDSEIIELFNKAEEFEADIISNSWGTSDVSDSVKNKIIDLANNGGGGKGTIIVFASGNQNQDMGNDESAIGSIAYFNSRNDYYGYGKVNLTGIMSFVP